MNSQRTSASTRGFTLMELMVAMAITTIIVTVLVSITSVAMDTWNRSRSEIRASRQAKAMIDAMSKDLESLVVRRGNVNEWLSAVSVDPTTLGDKLLSTNASRLVFFSASTDRYDGQIGTATDKGGDVSCVAYLLNYKDPISTATNYKTFVLSRLLVNPDATFTNLLGKTDVTNVAKSLDTVFTAAYPEATVSAPTNFVCENIYQFSLTFNVQVDVGGVLTSVPVTVGQTNTTQTSESFRMTGAGVMTKITNTTLASQVKAGKVTSVQISLTVLSDFGVEQSKRRTFANDTAKADFLAKNSYQYAKLVQLPSM